MPLITRTTFIRRKFRSTAAAGAALAVTWLGIALPGTALARITVSGFRVPPTLDQPSPNTSVSELEPAIEPAPDGSDAEWFVVNAQWQDLLSVTPSGSMTSVGTGFANDLGAPDTYASVDADGFDWVLDNYQGSPEQALYAVAPKGTPRAGVNQVASFNGYSEDITLGSDGALYIADNSGDMIRCYITAAPSADCVPAPITAPFDGGAYSVGSGGSDIWFTDAAGELDSYSDGVFGGPYWTGASIDPGTMVSAPNGYVYVAAGAPSVGGDNTEILSFSPYEPSAVKVAATGFANLSSMTLGPDGNIWFLDSGASGSAGVVGSLNITSGAVTELALPHGYWLPASGLRISSGPDMPGPGGTGEVFFTASTSHTSRGAAAIGEVSGIPMPVVPGALAFKSTITVSKQRVGTLTLTCTGATNAECAGKMTLSVRAKVQVRQQLRAARKGVKAKFRTVTRTKSLKLGRVAYDIPGGAKLHPSITLTVAAYKLLEQASGHMWTAIVTNTPTRGTLKGKALAMTGPASSRLETTTTATRRAGGSRTTKTGGSAVRTTAKQK
jgi:hypothetical protein